MKTKRKVSGDKSLQELMREHDDACALAARKRVRRRTKRAIGSVTQCYGEGKPLVSNSLGVHPDQVRKFNELYKRRGIAGAHHRPDGSLEITSRTSRNRVMEVRSSIDGQRRFDMDAGYGDRAD